MLHRTTAITETMPLVLLLVLLSSVASPQSTLERSDPLHSITADFSPKDPLFASGSTMELNGTLILTNATPPGITAHQVQCKYDSDNLTVIVLDNSTFQIRRENVMRHMTHGHVFCHLNVMGTLVKFAQVAIRVADLPVPPNITGCVVYNWVRMVCTWELPKQDTGLNTTYLLGWTLLTDFSACTDPKENSCEWLRSGINPLWMNMLYKMRMSASNALGTVLSKAYSFNTSNLVKPDPVRDLVSNTVTSQSVGLSWAWGTMHDDDTRHILYRVNYTSEWESKSLETTNKGTILSGLVPDTKYEISVECLPYDHNNRTGFWSETTKTTVSTDEDVPGRAPELADGSYSPMKRISSAGRFVELFWQPVPKRWLHGKLGQWFRIRCFDYWNRSHVLVEKFVLETFLELHVADGLDMAVTVEAGTGKGYNDSLDLKALVIPRTGLAPAKPGMVHAVKNKSEITVMWSSVANASGYTVYWCKKAVIGRCETWLSWTQVSPNITSWTIPTGNTRHGDFLVAISAEMYAATLEQNISSGMLVAECVPDAAKPVKPPELWDFAKEQQAFSLTVEWAKPKCEDTAYILKFEILYCQLQGCTKDECCNNKSKLVENNETKAVIRDLVADVEYEVSLRSISFSKTSANTDPKRRTVLRSGLTGGAVAGIVIAALVLFLFLVVGLLTIAKKIKKCFYCCEKIDIITPPSAVRMLNEQVEGDQVQYYRNGHSTQTEVEEQKTLLHDGKTSKQDAWMEDSIVIQRNGDDYRHPNMSKSFLPHVGDNGVHKRVLDESTDSGVGQSNTDSGVPLLNTDSGISTYTHLAVPDETGHSAHKQPNGSVAIGRVADPSSDRASHVLPRIATDSPPSLDVVEPLVAAVTEPYMPVEKIAPPVVGSASSSTITPYTTVDMAELKNFPESRGCLPVETVRQAEAPGADSRSTQPDDYQQVRCPIDDYISGSLANVRGKSPIDAADNGECAVDVVPLYANHEPPKSEDGYSDQRDIAVGTDYSANNPLLPVGYIPLAPTLST